jgi:hypothetical protein
MLGIATIVVSLAMKRGVRQQRIISFLIIRLFILRMKQNQHLHLQENEIMIICVPQRIDKHKEIILALHIFIMKC